MTELTTTATDDLLMIVDVSDTTGSSTGTNKKIQLTNIPTGITEVEDDTTPTLGGDLDCNSNDLINIQLAEFDDEFDNGNSSTADTIDWNEGNNQISTLTGNVTYTFTAPSGPARLQLRILTGAGSFAVVWPSTVKWAGGTAPTITTTASAVDIITIWYDGTNYYGAELQDVK